MMEAYRNKLDNIQELDEIEMQKLRAQDKFLMERQNKKAANLMKEMKEIVDKQNLKMFLTREPEGLNAVRDNDGWEELEFNVDSGATETVVGKSMLLSVEVKEGSQKRRGVEYEVANGEMIPNLGEKIFLGHTENGNARKVTAQVCDVNEALMSVFKMVAAGNKVVFGSDEGHYVEDKVTGERVYMEEKQGMFTLKMWVQTASHEGF